MTNCESDWGAPVLFLVMINDLLTDKHNRWKYVDDCSFAESVTPMEGSKLRELVNAIYNWFESNNMKMNISKCKEMIFDFARVKQEFLPLTIQDVLVERGKSARILDLIAQDNLKWNEHVNHIVIKSVEAIQCRH